jgi:hypothetical protein
MNIGAAVARRKTVERMTCYRQGCLKIVESSVPRDGALSDCTFKIFNSKQEHRVTPQIQPEVRCRPAIGHLRAEHPTHRNYLVNREGNACNAIRATVGYRFRRIISARGILLHLISASSFTSSKSVPA